MKTPCDDEIPLCGSLSVVMPAWNEENHIVTCLRRVLQEPSVLEVIVIDDASTDATARLVENLAAKNPRVRLERLPENGGKGAAIRAGFALAAGRIVLVQDADLEYDPADYAKLMRPILENRADVVFGSRFLERGPHHTGSPWHRWGNQALTRLSNRFTGLPLTDMECGAKVFRREVLARLALRECRFSIEPEIAAKVAASGARVAEVAVSYTSRSYSEGKKIGWKDGLHALWAILKYR